MSGKKCGIEIGNVKFCPSCGTCIDVEDTPSIGLNILSFIIPLFGLIYYFVKKKETKLKAEACLWSALGGFVVNLIIMTM